MHSFLDAKTMARALRRALADRDLNIPHGACLEIVARQFGLPDWNTLSAIVDASTPKRRTYAMADGWTGCGDTEHYRMGLDPTSPGVAIIECVVDRGSGIKITPFLTMMQSVDAAAWRGGKLRLSAEIRVEAADLGTIWLRVDKALGSSLRFDNMMQRPKDGSLSGTTRWVTRHIVLDVPDEAGSVHWGFFLKGYGKVWARRFKLEPVSSDAPTTEVRRKEVRLPSRPRNLDFSPPGSRR